MNSHEPMIPAAAPCEDRQFDLMELIDGALAPDEAARLQRHVGSCARCRAFVDEFGGTSRALAAALPRPVVSDDFDARLRARIAGLARTTRNDAAREWADREYREALDSLRRGLRWRTALNAIATAAVGGGVWFAVSDVAPSVWASLGLGVPAPLTMALALSALAIAAGAGFTRVLQRSTGSLLG
jgi:anti-sigma factor RsiW